MVRVRVENGCGVVFVIVVVGVFGYVDVVLIDVDCRVLEVVRSNDYKFNELHTFNSLSVGLLIKS